jgi:hypothetical protein
LIVITSRSKATTQPLPEFRKLESEFHEVPFHRIELAFKIGGGWLIGG